MKRGGTMKIADLHCDTISEIWKSRRAGRPQQLFQNNLHVDIQKMQKAGYLLQNFAMYIDLKKHQTHSQPCRNKLMYFYDEMEKNKDCIGIVTSYHEILANEKQGKMSALMTIEEGGCCKGELENLETLYQRGARMMTLTLELSKRVSKPQSPRRQFWLI